MIIISYDLAIKKHLMPWDPPPQQLVTKVFTLGQNTIPVFMKGFILVEASPSPPFSREPGIGSVDCYWAQKKGPENKLKCNLKTTWGLHFKPSPQCSHIGDLCCQLSISN